MSKEKQISINLTEEEAVQLGYYCLTTGKTEEEVIVDALNRHLIHYKPDTEPKRAKFKAKPLKACAAPIEQDCWYLGDKKMFGGENRRIMLDGEIVTCPAECVRLEGEPPFEW